MPEPVTCDDCGRVSAPMFWIGESIYCRPHVRERVDDWEWPAAAADE